MASTKRKEQAAATKQLLVETGKRMIAQRGYNNITVDEIVQACGVAKGTFYHYFDSKEDLFNYFEYTPYYEIQEEIASTSNSNLPILEKLNLYISMWFEKAKYFGLDITRQWLKKVATPNQVNRDKSGTKIEFDIQTIERYLFTAVDQGELMPSIPVHSVAQAIGFAIYGVTVQRACLPTDTFEDTGWIKSFFAFEIDALVRPYLKT